MPSSLRLCPLGSGTANTRVGGSLSGFGVRAGAHAVVLDLGAGALARLLDEADPAELDALVITHAHPDHCIDLFALHVYLAHGPGRQEPLPLFTPPGLAGRFSAFGGVDHWDEVFATSELPPPAGRLQIRPELTLAWQEVPHLPPTFALRLEHGAGSICFGADCGPNDELGSFARDVDVLILECSFGTGPVPGGVPHLDAAGVVDIARAARPGRLLLTHCYPEHDRRATLTAVSDALDCPVAWAEEGERVEFGD